MFSSIKIEKNVILAVLAVEILALYLGVMDYRKMKSFNEEIVRPAAGEPNVSKNLVLESDAGKENVKVNISAMARSDEEIEAIFDAAQDEIDKTIAGENEDLNHVVTDLRLKETYQGGLVNAGWSFDDVSLIDSGGRLLYENIKKKSQVRVFCDMSCENRERTYMFSITVHPPDIATHAGFEYLLNKKLGEADISSRNGEVMKLPQSLSGMDLNWSEKKNYRSIQLALFGVLVGLLMVLSKKEKEKTEIKERMKLLDSDYPDIVSNLSLYVGAGISIKSAVERIAETYKRRMKQDCRVRPGFEGICMLQREMQDGKGEIESYKAFGKRMGNKNYRKLSILLVQNIRKGTAALSEMLEKEEHQAFEERKLRAKILGEEASTKLLLPMVLLLMIVLFVLVFPAMQGINI